jgi:prevent-host-death family protein
VESVNVAEAKAHFSALVERAEAGEEIAITKRGKLVARLVPAKPPRKPIDWEGLRKLRESMPVQKESGGDFVRRMRDEDRY